MRMTTRPPAQSARSDGFDDISTHASPAGCVPLSLRGSSSSRAKPKPTAPARAHVDLPPQLLLTVTRCNGAISPGTQTALGVMSARDLRAHTVVPVHSHTPGAKARQGVASGWRRRLTVDPGEAPMFFPPLLLSARSNWLLEGDSVEVYDRAFVIDGARRLEVALAADYDPPIPITILFGLSEDAELVLRASVQGSDMVPETKQAVKLGTNTPRLQIGTVAVHLEIQSDPFVIPTALGYAPGVLVRRNGGKQLEHLLLGARSLSQPLETRRQRLGTLVGCRLTIEKQSDGKFAKFVVIDGHNEEEGD